MFITEILNRNKSLYFHYISLILLWKGIIHHLSKIESSSLIPSILWRKRYFDMFCFLDIASPWKSERLFIIYPKMFHANFEWDWPSHFGGDFQMLFHNHSTWKKRTFFESNFLFWASSSWNLKSLLVLRKSHIILTFLLILLGSRPRHSWILIIQEYFLLSLANRQELLHNKQKM